MQKRYAAVNMISLLLHKSAMPEVACEDADTMADLADPDHFDTNKPSVLLVLCSRIFSCLFKERFARCMKLAQTVVQMLYSMLAS